MRTLDYNTRAKITFNFCRLAGNKRALYCGGGLFFQELRTNSCQLFMFKFLQGLTNPFERNDRYETCRCSALI